MKFLHRVFEEGVCFKEAFEFAIEGKDQINLPIKFKDAPPKTKNQSYEVMKNIVIEKSGKLTNVSHQPKFNIQKYLEKMTI